MATKEKSTSRKGEAKRRKLDVKGSAEPLPPPKPAPPKKKTLYSGREPPIPPPALLDLVHEFLRNFNYVKAAHGVRTDNQKRPGHNLTVWKGMSNGLPDLLTLFLQWQQQNPEAASSIYTNSSMLENEGSVVFTKDVKGDGNLKERDSSSSPSSTSTSDSDNDRIEKRPDASDVGASGLKAVPLSSNGRKRKASEISRAESNSSSSSSSDSDSSDSDSEEESRQPKSVAPKSTKSNKMASVKEDINVDSASSKKIEENMSSSSASSASSAGSAGSESSESSESSSSDEEKTTTAPTQKTGITEDTRRNGSDSSSTLPPPEFTNELANPSSSSSSDSRSSSDSDIRAAPQLKSATDGTIMEPVIVPAGRQFSKPEVLVYNAPLSKRAKARGETLGEQKVVEATANNFKMLKKQRVPYSRIPTNLVVEEKFASNAYKPYDYANKAYQDLSVTKGKGFTKAKQKGKRGSYRGGAIDTSGGRGIKFED